MSLDITDLFNGLQDYKKYIQENIPFKLTSYTSTIDPTQGAGFNANVPAELVRLDGNGNVIEVYRKNGSAPTNWIKTYPVASSGGGGGSGFGWTTAQYETTFNLLASNDDSDSGEQFTLQLRNSNDLCYFTLFPTSPNGISTANFNETGNFPSRVEYYGDTTIPAIHRPVAPGGKQITLIAVPHSTTGSVTPAGSLRILNDGSILFTVWINSSAYYFAGVDTNSFTTVDANGFISYEGFYKVGSTP